ncbi:MAG: glutamate formimidoyltransferase [Bacteroidaceae bacterium]|nr:glutamate formimidoyltransferase [Bacteroidaceae bacterium]
MISKSQQSIDNRQQTGADNSQFVECVPNFSEGRNIETINAITEAIRSVDGVRVLHIDRGEAANRTVITFVGPVQNVVESAFRMVKCAAELIDMRTHKGEHPRIGATDVLPIIPLKNITLAECADLARKLGERIYKELGIPTYCYEAAAYLPEHINLADCRRGEYEGLCDKMLDPVMRPDFGGEEYTEQAARSGATVVGARNFLIAVNFNLNTASREVAAAIAARVRASGEACRDADGNVVRDAKGKAMRRPGLLRGCKAIGWYIEEFGCAQVSMNINDVALCPIHTAYETVCAVARELGAEVTGTELIGLIPEDCMIEAGRYFAQKLSLSSMTPNELMAVAVSAMNLDDLCPFDIETKVLSV